MATSTFIIGGDDDTVIDRSVSIDPQQLGGIEARVRYGIIDWAGTKAYFEENPYYPSLRINLKGRQPAGVTPQRRHGLRG